MKVCKFGGTSVADAAQIRKVQTIVQADPARQVVVVSAPGKRHAQDQKITDLLYLCHERAQQKLSFDEEFERIATRYRQIVTELALGMDVDAQLQHIKNRIDQGATVDYVASRGEYLVAQILGELLGHRFVDATELIVMNQRGELDRDATDTVIAANNLGNERAVVPGFYGLDAEGEIKTLSRGGSDVTGAVLAAQLHAEVYENWTDVSGLMMADPQIVDDLRPIHRLTYRELRELAYMGATVLHDEAIFPVRDAGIPVHIRNTNRPNDQGTMIVSELDPMTQTGAITGIAGQSSFTVVALEKALMNKVVGFGRRVLSVLERHSISFEHLPSGIDTMSIVIDDSQLDDKLEQVLEDIRGEVQPDAIAVYPNMALIATVGRGMAHTPGMSARLFGALGEARINVRMMVDQEQ